TVHTVRTLAALVGGEIIGDANLRIAGVSAIDRAEFGTLAFIVQARYDDLLAKTEASAVLIRPDSPVVENKTLIRVANPYLAFVRIAREMFGVGEPRHTGLHPTALVASSAEISANASIGAFCVIEEGVQIGQDTIIRERSIVGRKTKIGKKCQICNNVTIAHDVNIGDEVIIQSGSVVGSDGFGYVKDGDMSYKIPHIGTVVLENRVEIGANCTIDRATFGETRIKTGAKLDNLIHVAHNVEIGENTVIAAQTGISGSTKLGKNVIIAGQVGFVGHINIGDRTIFGAQAGVTKSIPEGITVSGYPAKLHSQAKREEAALRRAPEMLKRLKKLEKKLAELKQLSE
ncbi:MAG: UDP-3-O-(3-hydroxymyristoyl)glucosamine N-acyltransferase, partial [bacterium]